MCYGVYKNKISMWTYAIMLNENSDLADKREQDDKSLNL